MNGINEVDLAYLYTGNINTSISFKMKFWMLAIFGPIRNGSLYLLLVLSEGKFHHWEIVII